ncbi:bifunctional riboflavin kinase/FAD synthetase [Virgibacillus sp. NKC19-3]|uniref:bifunctional riboflavin kinase/FAD synthetase n=1 Tax=Virgibacillus saliphilus TaxID=2831674 RepID=UPI001C9BACF6|nr:bifunctional riboflavin kinase/FAD synthetase [Virgibacillus sp. NKC19-3]MBY7143625.1 bifunctional riboflavin kinase/FAD synthetase [Virgibacillus sp. NKC19-3]
MRTIQLTYPHTLGLDELPRMVSAIGFFDGVHKGHQKVIETAVEEAKQKGMESAVITFHPHPSVVLKKGTQHVKYITPLREKKKILQGLGVDRLFIIEFNKELSSLSPQAFIDHFIIGLNIKHLVAGFDYSYGHKGQGNMGNLHEHTRGMFTYTTVDKVMLNEEKISSTHIRNLLKAGNVQGVHTLLGRPLAFYGTVVKGDHRGREIGYPTANLRINTDALLPKIGVYAVRICHNNEFYDGMASIGTNPTFTADRKDLSVEVHIFDYDNNLYGETLQIEWHKYIRDEEKFDGAATLINQMATDEKNIRAFFSEKG